MAVTSVAVFQKITTKSVFRLLTLQKKSDNELQSNLLCYRRRHRLANR